MMPVLFVGHGSPMNAIERNEFTRGWREIANSIPKPEAILCISAHWQTSGLRVCTLESPKTIHDFYGFPKELFDMKYPAKGSPLLSNLTLKLLGNDAKPDISWGLDHGAWSVLSVMYPEADIPVFQMSLDTSATPQRAFELGQLLSPLRTNNVLILGSGNVVHNLGLLNPVISGGYDWAHAFDQYILDKVSKREFKAIFDYKNLGDAAHKSVPTNEHFMPLVYILGATQKSDRLEIYNEACVWGSLSMTSYLFK